MGHLHVPVMGHLHVPVIGHLNTYLLLALKSTESSFNKYMSRR